MSNFSSLGTHSYSLSMNATERASQTRDVYNARVLHEIIPNKNDAYATDDGTVRITNNGTGYRLEIKQDSKPTLFKTLNKKGLITFHQSETRAQKREMTLLVDDAISRVYSTYSNAQRRAIQKKQNVLLLKRNETRERETAMNINRQAFTPPPPQIKAQTLLLQIRCPFRYRDRSLLALQF